jgi:hypothetical protein
METKTEIKTEIKTDQLAETEITKEVEEIEPFRQKHERPIKTDTEDLLDNAQNDDKTTRRLTVEKTKLENNKPEAPSINTNHSIILLNLCHHGHRPMHKFPGFRILGAFPNSRALENHVKRYYENSEASLWATPVHQLMTICKTSELQTNVLYNKKQIETLVEIYGDAADLREREFKENIKHSKTGSVGNSIYKSKLNCIETIEKEGKIFDDQHQIDNIEHMPHELSLTSKIVNQSYAVIIILSDIRKTVKVGKSVPEPCFAILDVFESEETAMKYAQHVGSKSYPKCDIDVVDLYSWHFPENIHPDKIKDVYGHKRLDSVMTARKENNDLANDFEQWCTLNNIKPNTQEF